MTNYELLQSASVECIAEFLASETMRMMRHVLDLCEYGIHPQIIESLIYERRLEWLKSEVDNEK